MIICGFRWKSEKHICECISEDEHEEYTNFRHYCECGERVECSRNEESYTPPKPQSFEPMDESEIPF